MKEDFTEMKKFFALLLSLTMILALTACGGSKSEDTTPADSDTQEPASDFKVGFITLHVTRTPPTT